MNRLTTDNLHFTEQVKKQFGEAPDLYFRQVGKTTLVYLLGIVNEQRVGQEIIEKIESNQNLTASDLKETTQFDKIVQSILAGMIVIKHEGEERVLIANMSSSPHRSVENPETETTLRGPHEGFTELMEMNAALIRRRVQSEHLQMLVWHIGSVSTTEVRLVYLRGTAPQHVVDEMTRRLSNLTLDSVLGSGSIEEMIRDHPLSIFPTMQTTERPDVVSRALLNGKVAVLTANTPFALMVPFQFWSAFIAIEDYYINFFSATFLRLIRAAFIGLSILLPSLYVAITTFHLEMLPTNLLLSFTAQRETSPFPAIVEAIIMEITFEALREAAVRLPRTISQTVSIVGALVIGQAIVQAGIISTPMVIVVSLTGIASLTFPVYDMTYPFRILRFGLLLLAGSFGLFGIVIGLIFIAIYLTGLESAGIPYLSPLAPVNLKDFNDFIFRAPTWLLENNKNKRSSNSSVKEPKS
ncbi:MULTISPECIES: spore germination protein [Paenibacillus]|uniref:spore germination protein n=1 Tax=Paenibacillus TaxID=44249 RepID=UPI0022B88150|nr:spore germination protein [Paenibacillus caseinilyticus]MCZ8522974.1 spore germination protein [Paenibacillus caseinilyticus]